MHSLEDITDETLDLFIAYLDEASSRANQALEEFRLNKARAMDEKARHFQALGSFVLSSQISDADLRQSIYAYVNPTELAEQVAECEELVRPADNSHYDFLLRSYKAIRHFSPKFLAGFTFHYNPKGAPVIQAINHLRKFNESGKKYLAKRHAPLAFIPPVWRNYVEATDGSLNKQYYELCLLSELRTALRSGNIWVEGSRRYAALESYLIPRDQWVSKFRAEFCQQTGTLENPGAQLDSLNVELETAMTRLEKLLARLAGDEAKVRIEEGKFVLTPLTAATLPKSVDELKKHFNQRLPWVELISLLIEVDSWTKFSQAFEHPSGYAARSKEAQEHLYMAIVAQACNLSHSRLEKAADFTAERLTQLAQQGQAIEETDLAYISPVRYEHINPHGCYSFNLEEELGRTALRELRAIT